MYKDLKALILAAWRISIFLQKKFENDKQSSIADKDLSTTKKH